MFKRYVSICLRISATYDCLAKLEQVDLYLDYFISVSFHTIQSNVIGELVYWWDMRKQRVKICTSFSSWKTLWKGVPQWFAIQNFHLSCSTLSCGGTMDSSPDLLNEKHRKNSHIEVWLGPISSRVMNAFGAYHVHKGIRFLCIGTEGLLSLVYTTWPRFKSH